MKELEFTKDGKRNVWVAAAEVATDFGIKVKRTMPSRLVISVSMTEPEDKNDYVVAWDKTEPAVFNHDFDAKVYPKYLKIESYSEVVKGFIKEAEG